MSLMQKHAILEKNSFLLLVGILIVIAIGGLVEIVPLFYLKSTIEKVDGMRPYTPLELAGRNIYVREGCYNCHSQMIRPLRDEVERYGHYSLAAESMYDRPVPVGIEAHRSGPRPRRRQVLRRVASRAPERAALGRARHGDAGLSVARQDRARLRPHRRRPESTVGPGRAVLRRDGHERQGRRRRPGESPTSASTDLIKRYPKAQARDFDGDPKTLTEADALIAYLQVLGTLVDFKLYNDKANIR